MMEALKVCMAKDTAKGKVKELMPHQELHSMLLLPPECHTRERRMQPEIPMPPAHVQSAEEIFSAEVPRYLNESQAEAVKKAATQRICLIQGPPGTGKTTTAIEIVTFLLMNDLAACPILVTADSNTAVDNLTKGLALKGIKVVRIGRPESIRDDCKQYALEGQWSELKKAEVVCATCIGSGSDMLEKYRFNTVLVDECTQA